MTNKIKLSLFLGICLFIAAPAFVYYQINLRGSDPDPERFSGLIAEFVLEDNDALLSQTPIVFVGSSSIRGWNLAESFPELPSLNRGLGGAELSDLNYYLDETVLNYHPRIVVVYAGENDVVGGKSPSAVLDDYHFFVETVTTRLVPVSIVYISIKPTPSKWRYWSKMQETNNLIRVYSDISPNLYYVDISEKMFDESRELIGHLYANDGIHLSDAGYQIWSENLVGLLESLYVASGSDQESE